MQSMTRLPYVGQQHACSIGACLVFFVFQISSKNECPTNGLVDDVEKFFHSLLERNVSPFHKPRNARRRIYGLYPQELPIVREDRMS